MLVQTVFDKGTSIEEMVICPYHRRDAFSMKCNISTLRNIGSILYDYAESHESRREYHHQRFERGMAKRAAFRFIS